MENLLGKYIDLDELNHSAHLDSFHKWLNKLQKNGDPRVEQFYPKTDLAKFEYALKNNDVAYVRVVDRCGMGSYLNDSRDWIYRIYKKDSTSPTNRTWTGDFVSGYPKDVMYNIFEQLNITIK
jgi:hypothetical protein